ncbi:MAG: diguanylate cyclase, partial [Candidatus Omnitrophota bacterium]|nr:diguanylate cyclase [Candidatus Omnitrophota bacterium]
VLGKTVFELKGCPKQLAEKYTSDDSDVMRSGKRKIIEEPLIDKKGRASVVETIKTPLYDEKGEIIGTIGIAHDITERKRLQEQLNASKEKYRKLFEEANDAIFIGDVKTGKILDANVQAERLLGRTKDEICRMHQSQLHPPEEKERYKAIFKEDVFVGRGTHLDAEVIDKKGVRIPISISASVQEIGGRKIVMGIFKDMSEFRRIEKEKKEAESLALIDPHTQLYNYRYFQRRLQSEFEAAKRRVAPLSVLMVDIDYFKSINDTYGHEYGDVVLQEFATVLQHACREIDIVTRFEGEGFAIILPDTDEKGAVSFSERIQSVVKKHRFGKHRVRLMVSIGAVSYPSEGINSVDKLVTSVDKCVQMAKEKGGNTIFVYEQLRYKGQKPATIDKDSQRRVKEVSRKFIKLIQLNKQNTIEAVYALAHTVGAKNAYTEEHSEDMIHYATEIGKRLRMSEEELEDLKHGAMLHDIGKLGISDKILLKRGKLTKKEFGAIKKHPHIGADIIRPMHFLKSVVPIILHHHERFDGAGYGSRLKGEEIPLGARIVAIVDVYQALVSNRPYRKAYSKKEAIEIIKEESGGHFDPKITKVFLEILAKEKKTKKKGAAKKR